MNLDASDFDVTGSVAKVLQAGITKLFIALLNTERESSKQNKTKIISFLTYLRDREVDFTLTMPLPRDWFGAEYFQAARKLHAPPSWKEAVDLFHIEDGKINVHSSIPISGPSVKYMPSRNQIYEYFSFFHNRPKLVGQKKMELIKVGASIG